MKTKLLIIATVFNLCYALATPETIINKMITQIKGYDNITLLAEYGLINDAENIAHTINAQLKIKGKKYWFQFMGLERIFDGEKIYNINSEAEEVTIQTYNPQDDSELISPAALLTFFEEGFKYAWSKSPVIKGDLLKIQLIATENKEFMDKEIVIGIAEDTLLPKKMVIISKDGTNIEININSLDHTTKIPDNLFMFDTKAYEEYFIDDQTPN